MTLRYWSLINERYIIASTGVEHPSVPKNDKYIRWYFPILVVKFYFIYVFIVVEERIESVVGLLSLFLVNRTSVSFNGCSTRI